MSKIFRKSVASTGNWFKNIAKSSTSVSRELIVGMTPTTFSIGRDIKYNYKDLIDTIKGKASSDIGTSVEKLSLQSIRDAISDAVEMVKTGDFSDSFMPSRQKKEAYGGYDSEVDYMMSEIEEVDSSSDTYDESVVSAASNVASENVQTQTAILSNMIANSSAKSSVVGVRQIQAVKEVGIEVARGLQAINDNISLLVKFQSENMSSYISASYKFYNDMIDLTKTNASVYSLSNSNKRNSSEDRRLLDFSNNLDVGKYIKLIKNNFMNTFSNTSMQLSLLGPLLQNIKEIGVSKFTQEYLKSGFENVIKTLIPTTIKSVLTKTDSLISSALPALVMKMGFDGDDTTFLGKIKSVLGERVKPKKGISIDKATTRGPIPFDSETKASVSASLVYLRKILAAITGQDEMIYDYKSNRFTGMTTIKKKYNEDLIANSTDFSSLSTINKLGYSLSKAGADIDTVFKSIEGMKKYMYSLAKQDSMPDVKNKDAIYTGLKNAGINNLSDDILNQIAIGIDSLSKSEKLKLFGSGVLKTKYNLNSYMENLEMNPGVYAELFNDSNKFSSNKPNSARPIPKNSDGNIVMGMGSSIEKADNVAVRDAYGNTTNDYLRDLKYLLLKGIRVFPSYRHLGDGGNDPTAHIDEMLRAMGEEVKSTKANQEDFDTLASAFSGNVKSQSTLDRIDDELYDKETEEERNKRISKMMDKQKEIEEKESKKGFLNNILGKLTSRSGLNRFGPFRKISQFARTTSEITQASVNGLEDLIFKGIFGLEDGEEENLFKQTGTEIKNALGKFKDAFITAISPESSEDNDKEGFGETFKGIFKSISSGFAEFNKDLFGVNKKNSKGITFKEFGTQLREKAPSATAGATIGTVSSLIGGQLGLLPSLFLPGGPIGAAILGGTIGFLSKSEGFKKLVFGEKDDDGNRIGGLLSKQFQDTMKKKKNPIIVGSALGAVNSMVFGNGILGSALLGTGPIGGAILGTGLAIAASGETFKRFLFGEMGEDGKRDKSTGLIGKINGVFSGVMNKFTGDKKGHRQNFGKIAGGAITGTLASTIVGQMGLLGGLVTMGGSPIMGALVGAAAGITLSSKRWSEAVFGKVGEDGKRKGGKVGQLKNWFNTSVAEPMRLKIEEYKLGVSEWFTKHFTQPLKVAFDPLIQSIKMATDSIGKSFKNLGSKILGFFTGKKEGIMKRSLKGLGWVLGGPLFGRQISNWIDKAVPDKKSERGGIFKRLGRFGLGAVDKGIKATAGVAGGLITMPFKGAAGMINMYNKHEANKEYKDQLKQKRKSGEIGFWDYIDQKYDSNARKDYFMETRGYDPNYYNNIELDEKDKKDFAARRDRLQHQKEQLKLKQEFAKQRGYNDFDEAGKDISWMYDNDVEFKRGEDGNIVAVKSSPLDEATVKNHETVKNIFTETKDIKDILSNISSTLTRTSDIDKYNNPPSKEDFTKFKVPYSGSDYAIDNVDKYLEQIAKNTGISSESAAAERARDEMAFTTLSAKEEITSSTNADRIIEAIHNTSAAEIKQVVEEDKEDDKQLYRVTGRDEDGNILPEARAKRDIDYINNQRAADEKHNSFLEALSKISGGGGTAVATAGENKESWWSKLLPLALIGGLFSKSGAGKKVIELLSKFVGNTFTDLFGFGDEGDPTKPITGGEIADNAITAGTSKGLGIVSGIGGKIAGKLGNVLVSGANLFNSKLVSGVGTIIQNASASLSGFSAALGGFGKYKLIETATEMAENKDRYITDEEGNVVEHVDNASTEEALSNTKRHLVFNAGVKGFNKAKKLMTKSTIERASKTATREAAEATAKNVVKEAGEKVVKNAAEEGVESVAKKGVKSAIGAGLGYLKENAQKWIDKALKAFPEFFNNATVKKILGSKVAKMAKECFEKYFKEAIQKIFASDKLLGKFVKSISKKVGKIGLSAATLMISDAAFAAWDLITGATKKETADLFKIKKDDVTIGMRTISGLLKAVFGYGYLFIVDIALEILAEVSGIDLKMTIARAIYTKFSSASMEDIEAMGDKLKSELDKYNEENGTNMSLNTYSDMVNMGKKVSVAGKGNTTAQAKALDKVSAGKGESIETAAKENSKFIDELHQPHKKRQNMAGKGNEIRYNSSKDSYKKYEDGQIIGFGKGPGLLGSSTIGLQNKMDNSSSTKTLAQQSILSIGSAANKLYTSNNKTTTSKPTSNYTIKGPFTGLLPETVNGFAYFSQKDSRWAGTEYHPSAGGHFSDPSMAQRGCGPTAMAMVIKQLGTDKNITPVKAAEFATKNGYSVEDGTTYGFFPAIAKAYGLRTESVGVTKAQLGRVSPNTPMIISASGGSYGGGHYLVAVDNGKGKVTINDPISPEKSTTYSIDDIASYSNAGWFVTSANNKIAMSAIGDGYGQNYSNSSTESSSSSSDSSSDSYSDDSGDIESESSSSSSMSFLDKIIGAAEAITEAMMTGKPLDMSFLNGDSSSSSEGSYEDGDYDSSDLGSWTGETPHNPEAANKDYTGLDAAIAAAAGNPSEFVKAIANPAKDTYAAYGVYPSVTLAQAVCESGSGSSNVARKDKNLFGVKWAGASQALPPGMHVTTGTNSPSNEGSTPYRRYESYGDSIVDHGFFLRNNSRYPNAGVFKAKDGVTQAQAISDAGYAVPSYGSSLINNYIKPMKLYEYDQYIMDARENGGSSSSSSDKKNKNTKASKYSDGVVTPKSGTLKKVFNAAQELVNKNIPYVWGGIYPGSGGTDCSGLMQYSYGQAGISLPRVTYDQINFGTNVPLAGPLGNDNAKPGDLMFPHTGHVYMYAGNGKAYEAIKTGTNISVTDSPSRRKSISIRRIVDAGKGEGGGKGPSCNTPNCNTVQKPIKIRKLSKLIPAEYLDNHGTFRFDPKKPSKEIGGGKGYGISATKPPKYINGTKKLYTSMKDGGKGIGGGKGESTIKINKTSNTSSKRSVNLMNKPLGNKATVNTTLITNNSVPTLQKSYNVYNSNETTVNSLLVTVINLLSCINSNTGETVNAIRNIQIPTKIEVSTDGGNGSITNNIFAGSNKGNQGSMINNLPKNSQNAVIGRSILMDKATKIAQGGFV